MITCQKIKDHSWQHFIKVRDKKTKYINEKRRKPRRREMSFDEDNSTKKY